MPNLEKGCKAEFEELVGHGVEIAYFYRNGASFVPKWAIYLKAQGQIGHLWKFEATADPRLWHCSNPPVERAPSEDAEKTLDMARDGALGRTQTCLISETRNDLRMPFIVSHCRAFGQVASIM